MHVLQGIAVAPGVAIGSAFVLGNEGFNIPRRFVPRDTIPAELERLKQAVAAVASDLHAGRDAAQRELGEQYAAIFAAHEQLLYDRRLLGEIETLVGERLYSPEHAVSETFKKYAKMFEGFGNAQLAERSSDLRDLEKRLLGILLGIQRRELHNLAAPVIILAHDLTPGETASLEKRFALAFATEIGGAGGHTAIVAKGRDIPAVVGLGEFLSQVDPGDEVIIDGDHGTVILRPDAETLERYRRMEQHRREQTVRLREIKDLPAITQDHQARIDVLANIEFPNETTACREVGADGIGLYRTEFLYLAGDTIPDEEAHYQAYSRVVSAMHPRPVTIRTLDLGADKLPAFLQGEAEPNPFLGLRSIRLTLRNLPLFRTQLRAILRASKHGNVRIMFPLISTLHELRQAKLVLSSVAEDLRDSGEDVSDDVPIGMMVETPAAIIMIEKFLAEVDFISIGTNDLIQYSLAVDRSNRYVADLYQCGDPSVLRMIETAIRAAKAAGVPAGICGQMCAEPRYVMLLVGLGLRSLSVPPASVPEIKQICRSVTLEKCKAVAKRARGFDTAREVDSYLREELYKAAPEWAEE